MCCPHEALNETEPQTKLLREPQIWRGKKEEESGAGNAGVCVERELVAATAAEFVFVFVIAYWPSLWAT